jgi:phage-related protein
VSRRRRIGDCLDDGDQLGSSTSLLIEPPALLLLPHSTRPIGSELADKRAGLTSTAVWPIVYYRDISGREPVNDAILRLSPHDRVAIDNDIERLAEFGPTLPYPWSSQVAGELRELRADAGRSHNIFVLLHFLDKRVDRLPQADIEVADKRWADYRARMNAPVRRPPRAAGHDAP